MEILLLLLLLAGITWWVILRDGSKKDDVVIAPYKLEPSQEIILQNENSLQATNAGDVVDAVKKVRKPRTPKIEKETEKLAPKKVVVKKATTPTKAVAMKAPKSKKS